MRIEDILEAIDEIVSFTDGMTFETFAADRRTARAVLYDFVIIGEAARHVPSEVEARHPSVPWGKMRGMRNVMVHEYPRIVLRTVWDTLQEDLPPLVPLLRDVLEREP
jgi:uncharacterized protein with HEPN domain